MSGVDERVETVRAALDAIRQGVVGADAHAFHDQRYGRVHVLASVSDATFALSSLAAAVADAEQRADDAEKALREEWFEAKLPALDYQTTPGTDVVSCDVAVWAWQLHPWFDLLGLTYDECVSALAAAVVSAEPTEETA